MVKLPLKVQVSIRDKWDNPEADVQKALVSLRETIGVDVIVEPEWQLLIVELDQVYEDKSEFVPELATCVQAWANSLSALAEDEANADWAEELLDKAEGRIRLYLEAGKSKEPVLLWQDERRGFIVEQPTMRLPSPLLMESAFKESFLSCFKSKPAPLSLAQKTAAATGDDWADVSVDTATGKADVLERASPPFRTTPTATSSAYDILPEFTSLGRPDDLLLKPPYHLTVTASNSRFVEVQCSHSPTLVFLSDYLKKWCKVNNQDSRKPPSVEVNLYQSAFGLGLIYDRLTLESEARWNVYTATPMLVLSLVEGVLGYKSVRADDGRWVFRRDTELRKYR